MNGVTSATSASLYSPGTAAPSATAASGVGDNSILPASLELTSLQQEGQQMATLLGSLGPSGDPSSLFSGGSALSLLNAQGTAAMAYLAPQLPRAGQAVNALA